jgi:hypothetical protein
MAFDSDQGRRGRRQRRPRSRLVMGAGVLDDRGDPRPGDDVGDGGGIGRARGQHVLLQRHIAVFVDIGLGHPLLAVPRVDLGEPGGAVAAGAALEPGAQLQRPRAALIVNVVGEEREFEVRVLHQIDWRAGRDGLLLETQVGGGQRLLGAGQIEARLRRRRRGRISAGDRAGYDRRNDKVTLDEVEKIML